MENEKCTLYIIVYELDALKNMENEKRTLYNMGYKRITTKMTIRNKHYKTWYMSEMH
jgi:hypothetical protein